MVHPADVKTNEEAEAAGWTISFGPGDRTEGKGWELCQKAIYEDGDERIMHTTKRMKAKGGWLYEVGTTRFRVERLEMEYYSHVDYHHAKALTFAPDHTV